MPLARTRQQAWAHVTEQTLIANRPKKSPTVSSPATGRGSYYRARTLRGGHPGRAPHLVRDSGPPARLRPEPTHEERPALAARILLVVATLWRGP